MPRQRKTFESLVRCHLLVDLDVRLPPIGALIEPCAFMRRLPGPASSPELATSVEHKVTESHKGCSNTTLTSFAEMMNYPQSFVG